MSTVTGTCADCIVSLPVQPTTSLVFEIAVSEGRKAVIRRLGVGRGYYPSDSVVTQQLEIAPAASRVLGAVTSLCVVTNQPLQLTLTKASVVTTLTVNSVLILDSAYDAVTVTNPNTNTVDAIVSVYATVPNA